MEKKHVDSSESENKNDVMILLGTLFINILFWVLLFLVY